MGWTGHPAGALTETAIGAAIQCSAVISQHPSAPPSHFQGLITASVRLHRQAQPCELHKWSARSPVSETGDRLLSIAQQDTCRVLAWLSGAGACEEASRQDCCAGGAPSVTSTSSPPPVRGRSLGLADSETVRNETGRAALDDAGRVLKPVGMHTLAAGCHVGQRISVTPQIMLSPVLGNETSRSHAWGKAMTKTRDRGAAGSHSVQEPREWARLGR